MGGCIRVSFTSTVVGSAEAGQGHGSPNRKWVHWPRWRPDQQLQRLRNGGVLALLVDIRHRPVGLHVVSIGSVNSSMLPPAEVLKAALLANASAVIVAHNHPSGDAEPSPEDLTVTTRLREAGRLLGIEVLDHLIIGAEGWVSLKERGAV
jgi:DNA repair protein RadC